jgi:hypothetical protein
MTASREECNELRNLLWLMEQGTISAPEIARIESLVRADLQLLRLYVKHTQQMSDLRFGLSSQRADAMLSRLFSDGSPDYSTEQRPDLPSANRDASTLPAAAACPPVPIYSVLPNVVQGVPGYFSSGWPVAYLIATVVLGLGILVGSLVRVSRPDQFVRHDSTIHYPLPAAHDVVGRITGMADCEFVAESKAKDASLKSESRNPKSETISKSRNLQISKSTVSIGDKFNLLSGLLEITYDTGARVILQGPVTYKVESPAAGFLSLGKLTARVEKKAEGGRRKAEESDPQSLIPSPSHSPFPLPPSPFVIRTPTAIVTDLGTEFGVEVDNGGSTVSHVFRGSVTVRRIGDGGREGRILHENESARVDRRHGGGQIVVLTDSAPDFVRQLPSQTAKTLDLLDIVAGGDGTGHRRERGIDPTTTAQETSFSPEDRVGDATYRRVTWSRLIDGVFVPNGGSAPVVLDSAGHTFAGFPLTLGKVFGSIWVRAAEVNADQRSRNPHQYWVYFMGRRDEFMPNNRGLLGLHPNVGITFNLDAVRSMHPQSRCSRFRTLAGLAGGENAVDCWVFVDGRLKLKRQGLRQKDGAVFLSVTLGRTNHFLTLVATCGTDYRDAWFVLGEPVLETASDRSMQLPQENEAAKDLVQ